MGRLRQENLAVIKVLIILCVCSDLVNARNTSHCCCWPNTHLEPLCFPGLQHCHMGKAAIFHIFLWILPIRGEKVSEQTLRLRTNTKNPLWELALPIDNCSHSRQSTHWFIICKEQDYNWSCRECPSGWQKGGVKIHLLIIIWTHSTCLENLTAEGFYK